MLQWTLSTSDQYEDPSAHEIDVEKGMDKFSEVMDQLVVDCRNIIYIA